LELTWDGEVQGLAVVEELVELSHWVRGGGASAAHEDLVESLWAGAGDLSS